jgi:hypothetical protein
MPIKKFKAGQIVLLAAFDRRVDAAREVGAGGVPRSRNIAGDFLAECLNGEIFSIT